MNPGAPSSRVANLQCACPCGASAFEVVGKALARFYCHCAICQGLYKADRADVTAFPASAVTVLPTEKITYRRYRPPPAVRRGTCTQCGAPVVATMWIMPVLHVAFVPSRNVASPALLPAPAAHIFYHRRVADAKDLQEPHYVPTSRTRALFCLTPPTRPDSL